MGFNNKTGKCDIPMLFIIGKRKPSLVVLGNEGKIKKYTDNFQSLIEKFKGKPYTEVFDRE